MIYFLQVLASNPMDDSLNDIADVAPSRKRRQRRIQPLEFQTKRPALDQRQTLRYDTHTCSLGYKILIETKF